MCAHKWGHAGLELGVLQHVTLSARRELADPGPHRRLQVVHARVGDQAARRQHVQRAHVGWRRAGDRAIQAEAQRVVRAFVAERQPCVADADERPRVPEVFARDRRDAVGVARAVPIEHEVDPSPVRLLHPQHEREHRARPPFDPGQLRVRPHVAQDLQQPGGIVDARHPLAAGFVRRDRRAAPVGIDGDRHRVGAGRRDRARQPGELAEHGCGVFQGRGGVSARDYSRAKAPRTSARSRSAAQSVASAAP